MAAAQNQTGEHYRMDEGRKRVLANFREPEGTAAQPDLFQLHH